MNTNLIHFLSQYQIGANIRSQMVFNTTSSVATHLATNNHDLLPLLLMIEQPQSLGGSHPGRAPNLRRDAPLGHAQLMRDYFSSDPVYGEGHFRCCF